MRSFVLPSAASFLFALGVVAACGSHGTSTTTSAGGSASSASSGSTSSSGSTTTASSGASSSGAGGGAPAGLLDPDSTTAWNPGILADTPTGNPLAPDNLPVRTTICATVPAQTGDATAAINGALASCAGKHQVVALAAGKYSVSSTINVPSGVVLRGAGASVTSGTVIVSTNGGPVLSIGTTEDTVCYDASGFDASAEPRLAADASKETATLEVTSAAGFAAGDLALVDQLDDSDVSEGDCTTIFKRAANYGVSQRVEVAAVSGDTLTLTTPLHWTFKTAQSAQISRVSTPATKWAGIEDLVVQGGRPGGYPGQNAGGIDVSNAAYSWVKGVEVDGTTSGMPIRLAGTYRCVIRDSHFHNSYSYGFAQDNYGIVLACGAADNLVEDNVARFMNKPILFNNSGGGNVVGYNYADNSWSCDGNGDDGFQEVNIDCHCAFPHMELIEGNWAPHMGATTTHGNAGYLTYYRNYASSQWSPSKAGAPTSAIIWSQPFVPQYANVAGLDFPSPDVDMTVIGNVLGSTGDASLGLPADLGTTSATQNGPAATTQVFASPDGSELAVFLIDQTTVAWSSLWLTGNFDTVNKSVMWNASPRTMSLPASTRTLPASLYYAKKPGWWPAGKAWPWVGPDLTPMVGSLPAKDLSAAYDYYDGADGACTLDCATYCCSVGPACSL